MEILNFSSIGVIILILEHTGTLPSSRNELNMFVKTVENCSRQFLNVEDILSGSEEFCLFSHLQQCSFADNERHGHRYVYGVVVVGGTVPSNCSNCQIYCRNHSTDHEKKHNTDIVLCYLTRILSNSHGCVARNWSSSEYL